MQDVKRRFEVFSLYNHTGIEKHLEKMAARGWLLEKIGTWLWQYRRTEPEALTFAVSYYPKGSQFDPEPSEGQQTYIEFCERTGWKLAAASAQLQAFYTWQEDPTPINTEPLLEIETVHKAMKRGFLPAYLALLVLGALQAALFVARLLQDPVGLLSSASSLCSGLGFLVLCVLCGVELVCYFRWRGKAKKAAEQGAFLKTPDTSLFQRICLAIVLADTVYWVLSWATGDALQRVLSIAVIAYTLVLIAAVNGTKAFLKRRKAPAGLNRAVTLTVDVVLAFALMGGIIFGGIRLASRGVFSSQIGPDSLLDYRSEIPLTVLDLTGTAQDGYISEHRTNTSVLLGQYIFQQHPRLGVEGYGTLPTLEYTVTLVHVPALYHMSKDGLLKKYSDSISHYVAIDPAAWSAEEAFQREAEGIGPLDRFLLCYPDRIVELSTSWHPTQEQMRLVAERLGDAVVTDGR